jgi:hypothetical protein
MSPEEAGIEGLTATSALPISPRRSPKREPPGSTRKRRRVEQIVQSLQHSLQAEPAIATSSTMSAVPSLARIHPLVTNIPRGRKRVRVPPPPPAVSSEDESSGDEGLNLTVSKWNNFNNGAVRPLYYVHTRD